MNSRARLTIVDALFISVSMAVLGFLAQPLYRILNDSAGSLGTGEAYLMQMIVPGLIVSVLIVTFSVAVGGS